MISSPGQCGSVVWALPLAPKGCGFNCQFGTRSLVEAVQEVADWCFALTLMPLSFSLPLSLKINEHIYFKNEIRRNSLKARKKSEISQTLSCKYITRHDIKKGKKSWLIYFFSNLNEWVVPSTELKYPWEGRCMV